MKKLLVLTLALTMGLAAAAQADTFTETVRFGPGFLDFTNATGSTAGPGGTSLYYFDSNGGTLNSITFTSVYSFTSTITVTNNGSGGASGSVRTESGAQFGSSDSAVTSVLNRSVNRINSVAIGSLVLAPAAYDLLGNSSNYNLAQPGASGNFNSQNSGTSMSFVDTNASDLAAFSRAGGGTFTPLFSTLTGLLVTSTGGSVNTIESGTGQASLNITFDYSFAPNVPEPTSTALLGAGLLGLLGVLRRRK